MIGGLKLKMNNKRLMEKINWELRRYELAKAAMGAMVCNDILLKTLAQKADNCGEIWSKTLSGNAIDLADEMIKQLRKD